MARRQVEGRGVPVPYFVAVLDGKPDSRSGDSNKLMACMRRNLCWLCGEPLGVNRIFVVGPSSTMTQSSGEPPSHVECAQYAVMVCPFLLQPGRPYRDEGKPIEVAHADGHMKRNPGVIALWNTRKYSAIQAGNGVLFRMGQPSSVAWWSQGRPATRVEVSRALDETLPLILMQAGNEKDVQNINGAYSRALTYLPAAPAANQENVCAQ